MKPKLIVMSHGLMAQETLNSAKMIFGEIEGASSVVLLPNEGVEDVERKLAEICSKYLDDEQILIIVDLLGGTPSNVALKKLFSSDKIAMITGLNLTLVIEYALSSINDVNELADYLVNEGRSSIDRVQKIAAGSFADDEEYEE